MMLQPFSLFLMIFMQTDLKIKQTSANILLNCLLLSISMQFNCKCPKSGHVANNPIRAIKDVLAITLQDVEVFITWQENTLIVTSVTLKYSDFLISFPI